MKLTFEINGYVINIDETEDGMVSVSASKDDEVVEEFSLEGGEGGGDDDDFEGGEDDFEGQDDLEDGGGQELPDEGEPIDDEDGGGAPPQAQAQLGESKMESFAQFLKRK